MQELHSLETTQLIDLLANYTSDYTRMITNNITGAEYEKCKLVIKALQAEIEFRRNIADIPNTNITRLPDFS